MLKHILQRNGLVAREAKEEKPKAAPTGPSLLDKVSDDPAAATETPAPGVAPATETPAPAPATETPAPAPAPAPK